MNSLKSFFIIVVTGLLSILALAYYIYLLIIPTLPSINSLTGELCSVSRLHAISHEMSRDFSQKFIHIRLTLAP